MRFWQRFNCLFMTLLLMLVLLFTAGCAAPSGGTNRTKQDTSQLPLKIQVLDVGQGDAILIRTDSQVVLIDTGDIQTREKLVQYIKNQGITTIDKVIITHPHADHLGGIPAIFDNFAVKQIYDSGLTTTTSLYNQYLTAVQKKNIPFKTVSAGNVIDIGAGVTLKVLGPEKPFITNSELNNNSVVLKLVYGNFAMLLPGDAEREAETRIIERYGNELKSSILKAGHHGSSTSSTTSFLKAVSPEAIIISVGQNNDYHHPHPSVMKRYADFKAKIYRTDNDGIITITSDGQNYNVSKEK